MTLYSPLRRRVTASFCTHYRTGEKEETERQNLFYKTIMQDVKIIEWSFPEYIMNSPNIYTRGQFSLKAEDFIIVSAGNLPPDDLLFYDTMIDILKSNSEFIWLLVGCEIPQYLEENAKELFSSKKIINWGYENSLNSLYALCNVFVSPDKTGGSGTIAIAAQQNLPLVISDYPSDARRWIKKENCLPNGYTKFKSEIIKLYSKKDYYLAQSKKYKRLVAEASDSKKIWKKFNDILKSL